jgi:hypothetical protein
MENWLFTLRIVTSNMTVFIIIICICNKRTTNNWKIYAVKWCPVVNRTLKRNNQKLQGIGTCPALYTEQQNKSHRCSDLAICGALYTCNYKTLNEGLNCTHPISPSRIFTPPIHLVIYSGNEAITKHHPSLRLD